MVHSMRKFLNHPTHYHIFILPLFLLALTFPVTIGLLIAQTKMSQTTSQTLGVMTTEGIRKPQVLECSMCGGGSLCLDQNRKRAMCVPPSYAATAAAMANVTCVSCENKNCRYVEVQCTKAPCPKQYICN
jgi:hypothetical protein